MDHTKSIKQNLIVCADCWKINVCNQPPYSWSKLHAKHFQMDVDICSDEDLGKQDMLETYAEIKELIELKKALPPFKKIMAPIYENYNRPINVKPEIAGISHSIADDIFAAAMYGDLKYLEYFIGKFGANKILNLKTTDGLSILHSAARQGQNEICRYLILGLGFDVNMKDIQGKTPLHHAVIGEDPKTAVRSEKYRSRIMIEEPPGFNCLPTIGNQEKTIAFLIEHDVDVNAFSLAGYSALHFAALSGNTDVIERLLPHSYYALRHPTTDYGTPLCSAASRNQEKALELLIHRGADGGADVNYTAFKVTPLEVAIQVGSMEVFKALLKNSANANFPDIYGLMAIELAAIEGHSDMVDELFGRTLPIEGVKEWSVSGIMDHCCSEEFETKLSVKVDEAFLYYLSEGDKAYNAKKYGSAIIWYGQVRSIDEDDAMYFARKSLCLVGLKLLENAFDHAQRSKELDSKCALGWYANGVVCNLRELFEWAAESFEKACQLDPGEEKYQDALRVVVKNILRSHEVI